MISEVPGSRVEEIGEAHNVEHLFIGHNAALEDLLFNRNLVELVFRRACHQATLYFIQHLIDELATDVTELMILSKGLSYQLGSAFATAAERNLPCNLIATTRTTASDDGAKVEVIYSRFDAGGSTLIIGDTVASGATIITALDEYRQHHSLKRVYILSYAGSLVGAQRIQLYCSDHCIEVVFLFGLAAFGLARNGFDLSFLHPDTVCRETYRQRAAMQFGDRAVSAVGWDFGSQMMAPQKYRQLCWLEAQKWDLADSQSLLLAEEPVDFSLVSRERIAIQDQIDSDP